MREAERREKHQEAARFKLQERQRSSVLEHELDFPTTHTHRATKKDHNSINHTVQREKSPQGTGNPRNQIEYLA